MKPSNLELAQRALKIIRRDHTYKDIPIDWVLKVAILTTLISIAENLERLADLHSHPTPDR